MNERVLICGGRRWDQAIIPIGRGFLKLGCAVRYLPTRRAETHCDPLDKVHDVFARIMREFHPTVLFWTMCKQDCPVGLIPYLREINPELRAVFHSFDDPHQIAAGPPECIPDFDAAITCCEGSVKWYEDQGVKAKCFWPPPCVDLHGHAVANPGERCDLSFVGTNVYPADRFPDCLAPRSDILRKIADLGKLHIYGPWGERRLDWGGEYGVPELKSCWRGFRRYEELPGVYAASRINLSSHVCPQGYQYLNERTVNCMGSGGFVLVDRVNGIEEIFKPGVHLDTWATLDELRTKASYWLKHEDKRQAVAAAGRQLTLRRFSNVEHAGAVLNLCGVKR